MYILSICHKTDFKNRGKAFREQSTLLLTKHTCLQKITFVHLANPVVCVIFRITRVLLSMLSKSQMVYRDAWIFISFLPIPCNHREPFHTPFKESTLQKINHDVVAGAYFCIVSADAPGVVSPEGCGGISGFLPQTTNTLWYECTLLSDMDFRTLTR